MSIGNLPFALCRKIIVPVHLTRGPGTVPLVPSFSEIEKRWAAYGGSSRSDDGDCRGPRGWLVHRAWVVVTELLKCAGGFNLT